MLDFVRKKERFANLKKCWFSKDKIYFLRYILLAWGIKIEDKQIEIVKNQSKPKSV